MDESPHDAYHPAPLRLRSPAERQAGIDAYHAMLRVAKERAAAGQSLPEFVAFLEGIVNLMGPPSWGSLAVGRSPVDESLERLIVNQDQANAEAAAALRPAPDEDPDEGAQS